MWRRIARRRGSALVEFAMVVSLLVLLLIGTLVIDTAIYARSVVTDAAREAGRTWSIAGSDALARERATQAIRTGGLPLQLGSQVLFDPNRDVAFALRGEFIYVAVTYRQPLLIRQMREIAGDPAGGYITLRGQSVFRVER